jgi:hypothetical protein
VPDVHDREPGHSPRAQHFGGPLFQVRVVAPAPARLIEALLEIDNQQCGRMRLEGKHGATVRVRGHRTKTPMLSIGEADDKVVP